MFRFIDPFLKRKVELKVFVIEFEDYEYLDLDNPEDDKL